MAVLEKIRVKMGIFITIIIGLALISFIVDADTLRSAVSVFSSKYDVGEMNGESISYKDFQKKVDYYTTIHKIITNDQAPDDQAQDAINESAWQDLMASKVLVPQMLNAGIDVGDEEMFDLTQGSVISPVLLREQAFVGEGGAFDKSKLVEFIKMIPQDNTGNLDTYWRFLENNIKNEQIFSKYVTLLAKSNILNPAQLRRSIEDNNTTSDISFVMQPFGLFNDSTEVAASEVKKYYGIHKKEFKQDASRDLEYVVFSVTPSSDDISRAEEDMNQAFKEFVTTTNLKQYLTRNSDRAFDSKYYKKGELASISTKIDSFAFSSNLSGVLGVYYENDKFLAARINSIKEIPDSVFVQHILLQGEEASTSKTIDSLLNVINKGADFSELASIYSLDKNPNTKPGDLGWMTQSYMIPGFDTCFVVPVGKAFKLTSSYGQHVVRVSAKTPLHKKVQISILEKGAVASKETYQNFYTKANEFASKAQEGFETFTAAAKELNIVPLPAYGITEGSKTFATYSNAREITRWAYEAKKGDVSQIISLENKHFFVLTLTAIKEAGIPKLSDVKPQIESILRREKAIENMVAQVSEQIKGVQTIEQVAEKLGSTVSKQTGVSFGTFGTQTFDPKFIGAVSGAEQNKLIGPFAGSTGVYLFKVDARQTGSFYTEEDAKNRNNQFFTYQVQIIPKIMEEGAKVKDNRKKFF